VKIVVMTDVHANLPALEAALRAIRAEGCDAVFHTGDAIAIGPRPEEALELLLNTPNMHFVVGNHDSYFVHGLPTPQPAWMSDGEVQHQRWTHARLDPKLRSVLADWPLLLGLDFEGVRTLFVHYALAPTGQDFQPVIRDPTPADLDRVFDMPDVALIFYGHHHPSSDLVGRARYVNPGSLGCHREAMARYCVVEFHRGQYRIEHRSVPYDDGPLLEAFERRAVPEREFIYRAFFGGRFGIG
jgi:predicted phosphodiesterase